MPGPLSCVFFLVTIPFQLSNQSGHTGLCGFAVGSNGGCCHGADIAIAILEQLQHFFDEAVGEIGVIERTERLATDLDTGAPRPARAFSSLRRFVVGFVGR